MSDGSAARISSTTAPGEQEGSPADLLPLPGLISGRHWLARRDSLALARMLAEQFDGLRNHPGCTIIKENMVRTVMHLRIDAGTDLIVKHYRSRGPRDELKHLYMRTKASAEWRAAERLARAGINAPRMRAMAVKRHGPIFQDAALVMDTIAGARSPLAFLHGDRPRRLLVLEQIAALCANMHQHGIIHPDFHTGNLLAAERPDGSLELHVIDLHAVTFSPWVRMIHRVRCMGFLVQTLGQLVANDELRHMCGHYAALAGLDAAAAETFWARAARAAHRGERQTIAKRTTRCLKNTTRFTVEKHAGLTICRLRTIPRDAVLAAVAEHRANAAGATMRTSNAFCVREWLGRGLFRRSPARAAWLAANGLLVRGISTPEPLAMAEDRRSSFLITRYEPNARPLPEVLREWADHGRPPADELALAAAIADTVGKLHARTVDHRDLHAGSFLVEQTAEGWKAGVVRTESVRFPTTLPRKARLAALARLNDLPACVSMRARAAFLRRYRTFDSCSLGRSDVRQIARATAAPGSTR